MLRIIPLGGIGHVTNNMYVYEYISNNKTQRLIVDCGIGFPEDEMLGADLLVPDISYLKGKEDTIVGIVFTHGHDDHIAGLPYILPQLNTDFPIYGSKLTAGFAQADLKEFGIKKQIQIYPNHILKLGDFDIDPIDVTHSVPDTKHLLIKTPEHTIYHGSDFKLDWTPVDGITPDIQKMAYYGNEGVDFMMIDCLRVESEGYSLSETKVSDQLSQELKNISGKVVVTTMSSNIHRIQQIVNEAISHNRKVAFIGRSVEENIKISQRLGFIDIPSDYIVHKKRISKINPEHLCLIVAGSQGQEGSTLTRISTGEHDLVKLSPGDHVVFSADPIPGNESNVYKIIDNISKTGATISYKDVQSGLHVSGHASAQEQRMMLSIIKPRYVLPIGGTVRHMNQFRVLARGMNISDENIITPEYGEIIALEDKSLYIDNKIKLKTIIVDGLGIGDVGPLILSDRKKMANAGMLVVAVPVDYDTNEVLSKPEVLTRGFVFAKQSKDLISAIIEETMKTLPPGMKINNWKENRDDLTKNLERFLFIETQREPLILVIMVKS